MTPTQAVEIFFSYAQEDRDSQEKLASHLSGLERQGKITVWDDREVGAGTERSREILKHLNSAHIILLLISSDFLDSDHCYNVELTRAMARHEAEEAYVIPILIDACDWEGTPFGHLQVFPRNSEPIVDCPNPNAAFAEVAKEIRKVVGKVVPVQQPPEVNSPPQESQKSQQRIKPPGTNKVRLPNWRIPRNVLMASVAVTILVGGVRWLGLLQPLELKLFDNLMSFRVDREPDNRLLLIEIDRQDIEYQENEKEEMRGTSLSEVSLERLLDKLQQFNPVAIGLDMDRDTIDRKLLKRFNNLFLTCKGDNVNKDGKVVEAGQMPKILPTRKDPSFTQIPTNRIGFIDVKADDEDGVLRRQFLAMKTRGACKSKQAISLLLAGKYLEKESIYYNASDIEKDVLQNLKFTNGITFKKFTPFFGGYQGEKNIDGNQILINYRSFQKPARGLSLQEVLKGGVQIDDYKNPIIIIGATTKFRKNDFFSTPYGIGDAQQMPGVWVQAHMVSQILDAVLGVRPLLWVWSRGEEFLWILAWSLVGGLLTVKYGKPLYTALAGGVLLYLICFVVLWQKSGWLPLLPSFLSMSFTGVLVQCLSKAKRFDDNRSI